MAMSGRPIFGRACLVEVMADLLYGLKDGSARSNVEMVRLR